MNRFQGVLIVSLVFGLSGCAMFGDKEAKYLCSAQDRATQAEVRDKLGPPLNVQSTLGGESIWTYQVRENFAGSRVQAAGAWCHEYVLTFDYEKVLRHWNHQKYFHGGETQPAFCVPGGTKPKS